VAGIVVVAGIGDPGPPAFGSQPAGINDAGYRAGEFCGAFAAANAGDFNHACAEHLVVGFRARRGEDRFGLRSRQRGIAALKARTCPRTPNLIRFIRSLPVVASHPWLRYRVRCPQRRVRMR